MMAAMTPQAWMARCAGVQKVSRPMERCQETSHAPPIKAEVTARAPNHRYQGMRVFVAETWAARWVESGKLDIKASQFLLSYNVVTPRSSPSGGRLLTLAEGRRDFAIE